jgi:hypothetical protein
MILSTVRSWHIINHESEVRLPDKKILIPF